MTFTETITTIFIQTIANIVSNLAWFILIYWGVKTLAKEVPKWLRQYEEVRTKERAISNAMNLRR